jgi:hypothetical protein
MLPTLPIERLWQVVAVVVPIIMTAGTAAFTIDTWWDLAMGRVLVERGTPFVDVVFGVAPAEPGVVQGQWLALMLLYGVYSLFGEIGLRLFAGGLAALAFGLLVLAGTARGGTARTSALGALLATFIAANNLATRAQLFSFALFALVYLLLASRRRHPRGLYAIPILARYAAALPRPGWLARPHAQDADGEPDGSVANWLLAGLLVTLSLASPLWRPALASRVDGPSDSALYGPASIADAAATLPEGARMSVFQPWSGYLTWRLWPHQQPMVDARFEAHPSWVWDE